MSSSRTIFNLIRLYFKIYSDESFSKKNIKSKIAFMVPVSICVLTILGLLEYSIVTMAGFFVEAELSYEYLTILFLLIQTIQFVFAISNISKNLFGAENEDIPKLPATGIEIFTSKIIYLYIHELMFSSIIILPFLLTFAILYKMSVIFYVMIIPVCLLFPIFPFLLALLFTIPVMYIRKLLKDKFLIILLGSIISISVGYVVYMYALEYTLKLVFFNSTHINFTPEIVASITQISRNFFPERLLCNLLYSQDLGLSLLIIIASTIIVNIIVFLIADKWYYKAFVNEVENVNALKKRKSHIVKGGAFIQLANKEFVNIFRSTNYSFQYLALAASMPVMVFFCTKVSLEIGTENVGSLITPGITCLVIIMFTSLSSSFSASAITREGNKTYMFKLIPQSITQQITAKFFVYSIVSILSISITSILILAFKYLDVKFGLSIWASCIFVALAIICNAIKTDLRNPKYNELGNGEMVVSTNNTIATISIGILVSLIFGIAVIMLHFVTKPIYSVYFMLSASALFFVASITRLYIGLDKLLNRIEP